ncbi:unnamed protein product [Lampetra fluviatilis]
MPESSGAGTSQTLLLQQQQQEEQEQQEQPPSCGGTAEGAGMAGPALAKRPAAMRAGAERRIEGSRRAGGIKGPPTPSAVRVRIARLGELMGF